MPVARLSGSASDDERIEPYRSQRLDFVFLRFGRELRQLRPVLLRELANQHGRAHIADHCLGQLLSKAPAGGTGVRPCVPVCDAMERIASPAIARGFIIGVRNARGAQWRGGGGGQEREIAAKYRGWSQQLAFEYPHVASVLADIAASYDHEAEWHDSEAKVSKRLRH